MRDVNAMFNIMASKVSNLTVEYLPAHTGNNSKKNNRKMKSYLGHAGAAIGEHIGILEEMVEDLMSQKEEFNYILKGLQKA